MNIADLRRDNLRALLNERFEGKKAALAHAIEREPSYISRCLSDKAHRKKIGEDFARHIEKALALPNGWMDRETTEAVPQASERPNSEGASVTNIREAPQPLHYHRYPVISRVQAGAWTECVTPYEPGAEPHEESTDYRAQGKAFWLEVQGDSMTAPPGMRPSVPEGTLVLFDTGIEAAPGKLVAALLADSNEATFKQLIEDSGQRYLKALNPAYPLIPINGNCRILGVAVEAKTRL
ncbi:LexA family protein [Halomonas organivorans]|uniref:SOS-response transcriptional repressor LexA n=1 Tax=Halomonas organivorans TaxID=257772 RepID=A0A7W5G6H8_9GAMM|nr:S24 family peptidase [Halomonas organivorans]MBB3142219.1 SOS-response transcriptional repressor LexA [Halomonas organivorans]